MLTERGPALRIAARAGWRSPGPAAYEQRQLARARAYHQQVCAYKASFLAAALQAKRRLVSPAVATADEDFIRMRYYVEIRRQRRKEAHEASVALGVLDVPVAAAASAAGVALDAAGPAPPAAPNTAPSTALSALPGGPAAMQVDTAVH